MSALHLAPRASAPPGGGGDDAPPPGRAVIDVALAEALRGVAVSIAELSARVVAHSEQSTERHEAILREVGHLADRVEELHRGPSELAEARRRADTEASITRVRAEMEAAVAEQLRIARADVDRAQLEAGHARAQLVAARARQSASRAAWGLLGDTLRACGRWATSTPGVAAISGLLGAAAAALAHWLLQAAGAPR